MCPFRAACKTPATRGNNTEVLKIFQKSHKGTKGQRDTHAVLWRSAFLCHSASFVVSPLHAVLWRSRLFVYFVYFVVSKITLAVLNSEH